MIIPTHCPTLPELIPQQLYAVFPAFSRFPSIVGSGISSGHCGEVNDRSGHFDLQSCESYTMDHGGRGGGVTWADAKRFGCENCGKDGRTERGENVAYRNTSQKSQVNIIFNGEMCLFYLTE